MTNNKYWVFLENLRRSGITNMYGAAPYVTSAFGVESKEARKIVSDWMQNYNPADYEQKRTNLSTAFRVYRQLNYALLHGIL